MAIKEIAIPDLGGAEDVEVIEILVKVGDHVKEEDSLLSLESDKATMEVPAPFEGTITALQVKLGDKLSEGSVIMTVETDAAPVEKPAEKTTPAPAKSESAASTVEVPVPDIGGDENVDVIEVSVKSGDQINEEDTLITLESDKATMDVPAPYAGTVAKVMINVGDKVSEGSVILTMTTSAAVAATPAKKEEKKAEPKSTSSSPAPSSNSVASLEQVAQASAVSSDVHASPSVRRTASEFGIDLKQVSATGQKGRVTKEDVQLFVKQRLASSGAGGGFSMPQAPVVDFSKFGETETVALNKIKRLTGQNLSRNWMTVPHVTQFDEADITELEAFRKANKAMAEKQGFKLTPLVFIMKALVSAMKQYPRFNSSLSSDAQSIIYKKYYNIGIAVDTPDGLVVPVVKDVDQKGAFALAKELGEISVKARDKKLMPRDMQGGCMTISSLGGIGGTCFTPIVNAPEVAILGVSKAQMKPVFQEGEFVPRLMLPLSLSYDHRVVDGAEGARFITHLNKVLSDLRQLTL
jgi:pyruvate dehydrogenase E2 component (dihydrolipoamide acetyltransferase)